MIYASITPFTIHAIDLDASCTLANATDVSKDCDVILDIARPHTIEYEMTHLLSNDNPYQYWSRVFWNLDLQNQDVHLYANDTGTMQEINNGNSFRTWWPFWRHLASQEVNDNELCRILTDTSETKLLSPLIEALKTASNHHNSDPKNALTAFQESLQHVLSGINYSTPIVILRFIVGSAEVTKSACVRIAYASDTV